MGKNLYIAEKPSVAREFAKALQINAVGKDGYLESADSTQKCNRHDMLFFK